ncbi:DUF4335 domain-containing protein [Egbenema bharatensis]|uniref:DUF4335 domain-containing protein n=1 Tax=Egbenema bharatensis TaxID=3463334 RepID=UPI003A84A800
MSTSVLRRYTPPTCTLEIAATGSVLSRWTDRTVLKNLRFQLNFDDPTLPPEKQVKIHGDRSQLEALCEVVEGYVQSLLAQPSEQFHRSVIHLEEATHSAKLLPFPKEAGVDERVPDAGIHLKPKGLLAHELELGTLASSETGSSVALNTLQLFDLSNALDEYRAEALSLPALSRPAWLKSPASWTKVAAVLVLALGATGAVTKFVLDIASPVQVASSESAETSDAEISSIQRSDLARLPVPASGTTPSELDLKLQSQFPPKPPTEALQPEGVAELPPVGITSVSPDQLAALPPSGAAGSDPASGTVILVPSDVPVDAAPDGDVAQASLSDPLANAVPTDPNGLPTAALLPSYGADRQVASTASRAELAQSDPSDAQIAAASGTAFDTHPQIAEIRNYFLQNWQPPAEMSQTIQYRLQLNPNGSIRLITPMGTASEQFVDRTNMPLMDEPFVSPLQGIDSLQVRLVLDPDGRVQVFPDGN